MVADGLAEYQVRWANVPIVFCETRQLAEHWTYRFLAAAYTSAHSEPAALARITGAATHELHDAPAPPEPTTSEVRAWARANNIPVPGRGRLRPEVRNAWHTAHAHTDAS